MLRRKKLSTIQICKIYDKSIKQNSQRHYFSYTIRLEVKEMIKAIFFDIDGTLLSSTDGSFADSTRFALTKLQEKGIKIFIASGRHVCEIEKQPIRDIPFDGYACLNGQLIFNKDKEIIQAYPFNKEDTENTSKLFKQKEIPMVLVQDKELYINFVNEYVKHAQDAIATDLPPIKEYQGGNIYQVTAFSNEKESQLIMNRLSNCKLTRWNPYGVDIISNTGGKSIGIKDILSYYDIKQEETMAFGDGENDIDMLRFVQIGVAMQNAEDCVKEAADYITDTSKNDGIYKALKHFNIL